VGLAQGQPSFRALVADDRDENRLLLVQLLVGLGAETREARNGEEALAVWREWRPQVVFMDMRMPVLDGFSATRRLRQIEESDRAGSLDGKAARTTVIACTASVLEHDREAILQAGCDDFLPKPVREGAVANELTRHLGLRFVYEDDARGEPDGGARPAVGPVVSPERLAALPRTALERLEGALVKGDDEEALAATSAIDATDAPLAEAVRDLLRQFRSTEVLEAIERIER
jgi:CheY-like chemotaxis protein